MYTAHQLKSAKASYSRIRRPYFIGHLTLVKLFSLVQALVGVLGSGIRNYSLVQALVGVLGSGIRPFKALILEYL